MRPSPQPVVIVQEKRPVAADPLRSKPEPGAAKTLVWPGYELLDPVCDSAKRHQIALRELARPVGVAQVIDEEKTCDLCRHGVLLRRRLDSVHRFAYAVKT